MYCLHQTSLHQSCQERGGCCLWSEDFPLVMRKWPLTPSPLYQPVQFPAEKCTHRPANGTFSGPSMTTLLSIQRVLVEILSRVNTKPKKVLGFLALLLDVFEQHSGSERVKSGPVPSPVLYTRGVRQITVPVVTSHLYRSPCPSSQVIYIGHRARRHKPVTQVTVPVVTSHSYRSPCPSYDVFLH